MERPWWDDGLRFACTSCGHCCRHEPGYVFLSEADVDRAAAGADVSTERFVEQYCRSVDLGLATRLSLLEKPNHDCVFWNGGCSIYLHRPLQCRTYPFWPAILASKEDWDREARDCPGMNAGRRYSGKDISKLLSARERDILITLRQ